MIDDTSYLQTLRDRYDLQVVQNTPDAEKLLYMPLLDAVDVPERIRKADHISATMDIRTLKFHFHLRNAGMGPAMNVRIAPFKFGDDLPDYTAFCEQHTGFTFTYDASWNIPVIAAGDTAVPMDISTDPEQTDSAGRVLKHIDDGTLMFVLLFEDIAGTSYAQPFMFEYKLTRDGENADFTSYKTHSPVVIE